MKKIIGITANADYTANGTSSGQRRHVLNAAYAEAVAAAGAVPLILVRTDDEETARRQISLLDGIVLSGGGDVAPVWFGEEPHANLGDVDDLRDAYEIELVKQAKLQNKPLLGICRGMQVMNVALGGTLYQDLSLIGPDCLQHRQSADRDRPSHSIRVAENTWLRGVLGGGARVNSFHHQAIKAVANDFIVNAVSPDGVIEGIEKTNAPFMLGVQWHPEHMIREDAKTLSLFEQFLAML